MDVLVNFSDLINKNRKDLSSWKAACDAVNNMMRIYPECFSMRTDSFAPLRVHANVGSIDGVDLQKLETFLAKFLLVLDNEVNVEKVDFSGEKRFIEAGEQAAYCININGGVCHHKDPEHNLDLMRLRYMSIEMKPAFSQDDLRLLFHGATLDSVPRVSIPIDLLCQDLTTEFLAGGDRFSTFDISMALEGLKAGDPDALKVLEDMVRSELKSAVADGIMSQSFLDKEVKIWITDNDIKNKHLGMVFDQYSTPAEKKTTRLNPKDVYEEMTQKASEKKEKGLKI